MARRAAKTLKATSDTKASRGAKRAIRKSLGSDIVGRLKRFVGTLEAIPKGTPLSQRFTARTIRLKMPALVCTPQDVKATREILGASQAVFAQFLGVSASAVQDWEQGNKPPRGSACRLMSEIRRDPTYWKNRFAELVRQSA